MKLNITREWLARQIAHIDDSNIGAGSELSDLKRDVERRTVTPAALVGVPNQLGKAIRYVREERGWSVQDLAKIADVDQEEIVSIESSVTPHLSPRTAIYLADALGWSRSRMQQCAGHAVASNAQRVEGDALPFAARSRGTAEITDEQYEAVRALVSVLAGKDSEDQED